MNRQHDIFGCLITVLILAFFVVLIYAIGLTKQDYERQQAQPTPTVAVYVQPAQPQQVVVQKVWWLE